MRTDCTPRLLAASLLAAPLLAGGASAGLDPAGPAVHAASIPLDARHDGDGWSAGRPDGHAPIGVMGDHTHSKGEWMLSVRFMRMYMEGTRDGTTSIPDQDLLVPNGGPYMVVPTRMTMDMLMLGAMYAPSDDITLTAMLPYQWKDMDHLTAMGGTFTTRTDGVGDVKLGGLFDFWEHGRQASHFNLAVSVPTGSITETGVTPASAPAETQLPYPMQLGSGTWDLLPGITYLGQTDRWSWGGQWIQTIRLGTNDRGYTLGPRTDLTGWGAWRASDSLSLSLRLVGALWGNIDGADPDLNPAMVYTADPDKRGGRRVDLAAGVNWYVQRGLLRGNRLALEFGVPVYQDLDGPQLETDWTLTLGWQLAF